MQQKKAFNITVEFILVLLLCGAIVGVCLTLFTDNLSTMFSSDRNYKKLFERTME